MSASRVVAGIAAGTLLACASLHGEAASVSSVTGGSVRAFVPVGPAPATPLDPDSSPAVQYAALDRPACEAELAKRAIPYTPAEEVRGVLAPIRLSGALHGVTFRSPLPAAQRAKSSMEIIDCRLALALDDFAAILAKYDVTEVVHLSAYRAPSARAWHDGKLGSRHNGGLAMDMGTFRKKDGTELRVERDFHGAIGARTCGPAARTPMPSTAEAVALRGIVCDAADAHLFNVALTPDYNWAHRNHYHLEVTPRVKWFVVH